MGAYASLEENAVVKIGVGGNAVATVNGAGIDTAGYSEALVILATGLIASTGTLDVKIEDSADNSSWADVTGALFAQLVDANDQVVKIGRLKLDGNTVRRYIRVTSVVGTAVATHTAVVVLCGSQYKPQDVNTIVFTK